MRENDQRKINKILKIAPKFIAYAIRLLVMLFIKMGHSGRKTALGYEKVGIMKLF